jgi:hypothetical protein
MRKLIYCRVRFEVLAAVGHNSACYLLHPGFLLGLFFDPEDGGDIFHRNISELLMDYTALHPRT